MNNLRYLVALLICCYCITVQAQQSPRTTAHFNAGWKFLLGNDSTAIDEQYNDAAWRTLNLPHDWSIEGQFSETNPTTTQGGALPTGIGWYRKTFVLPAAAINKAVYIEFDGVYCNSEVWINGHYLGKRPNGYSSFRYNLTEHLKQAPAKNVIVVKVDNSRQPASRWYTGSGIYRHVRLVYTSPVVAIDHWGVFITTPTVTRQQATINVQTTLTGPAKTDKSIQLYTDIYDATGKLVARQIAQGALITINNPQLWSTDRPYLYKAVTRVVHNGKTTDEYSSTFGIRYFNFDVQKGFSLNGRPLKILGVCNHHDLGALGAAINVKAMERQLQLLKAMGCNAIRTAHNPPAPELLDLCDRMGFLVMDEAFDMWRKRKNRFDYHLDFDEWHKQDVQDMVRRDRNHPSVIMWSIGNEIREQFDSTGIALTKELVALVKAVDPTRPVTAALTETDTTKNFMYQPRVLDIMGLNYNHDKYAEALQRFPGLPFIAAETMSALASRGHYDMPSDSIRRWPARGDRTVKDGNPDLTVSAYDNVSAYWGSTHEETWKVVKQHDFIAGLFVWTGFDYLGEPTPYPWPARSSYFGIIDLAGFPKDVYYMYQSEWTTKPVLHVFPHWNQPAGQAGWQPGKLVDVWAYYNNADEVELFLNGRSLGIRKKQPGDLHVMWRVHYTPGKLVAVSRKNGRSVLVKTIKTTGKAVRLELVPDKKIFHSNGSDLSFVTVRIKDAEGNIVPDANPLIHFEITGAGFIAGVDNGDPSNLEPFKAAQHKAYNGLCLAIIQSNGHKGSLQLKATAAGLLPAVITLHAQ